MSEPVLQSHLPHAPWLDPVTWRLPGTQPIPLDEWLIRDSAFAGQMRLRDELIASRTGDVHAITEEAKEAAKECLELALMALQQDPDYQFDGDTVLRPDGIGVPVDWDTPLITLGRLQQADICLMQDGGEEHVLTGAILCFPAHWTLSEKIGKPLLAIHKPVREYTPDLAKRVQRLFDALRPGQLLCRSNALLYEKPDLFTPKSETAPVVRRKMVKANFIRSERQTLRRLPKTGAVAFAIHTFMVPIENLSCAQRDRLHEVEKD